MLKLQIPASFKNTNSTLKPSATRIINRDLTSAKLLISQFVKLSSATNLKPAFSGENNGKGAATKIIEHLSSRIAKPWGD